MASAHVVRKAGIADTAFNHKIYNVLDDDHSSDDSDDESPETKNQNFEFSDSYGVMRFIKLVLFIQVIGIMLDNPSTQYSVVFRIVCRGIIYYSMQFYSRPFIDLIYIIQYFLESIIAFVQKQQIPATPSSGNIEVDYRRRLNVNPYSDRGSTASPLDLTIDVIDPQRTINDCWNKILEWKNRCLNPQWSAPIGAFRKGMTQLDDIPGIIRYYNPVGGQKPEQEKVMPVPGDLHQILETAIAHMRALAADVDVQPEARLAGKTAALAVETGQMRWQSFLGDLAEFHSRLARHMLSLVQVYYDDERTIQIPGQRPCCARVAGDAVPCGDS